MLPSCRRVSEMASDNVDKPITGVRWFKMKLHLLICVNCRRYAQQIFLTKKVIESTEKAPTPCPQLQEKVEQSYKNMHCHKEVKE